MTIFWKRLDRILSMNSYRCRYNCFLGIFSSLLWNSFFLDTRYHGCCCCCCYCCRCCRFWVAITFFSFSISKALQSRLRGIILLPRLSNILRLKTWPIQWLHSNTWPRRHWTDVVERMPLNRRRWMDAVERTPLNRRRPAAPLNGRRCQQWIP